MGITIAEAEYLRDKILEGILQYEALPTRLDEFGQRYQIEFDLEINGRSATILTSWILIPKEISPRLTTCYIK